MQIQVSKIKPSPEPIRKSMDEAKLQELAQSIREQGLIVPIKVRPNGTGYEIVYGHRRFTAAQMAGMEEIEAIVEGVSDDGVLIQALIENVVREDMEPMDIAQSLHDLIQRTGWNQSEIHRRGIMHKRMVGQYLSLLDAPEQIQSKIKKSEGGSRPENTIGIEHVIRTQQVELEDTSKAAILDKAAGEGLTVKQTRQIAEAVAAAKDPRRQQKLLETPYDPHYHDKEWVEWREKEYGAADPDLAPKSKPKDEDWRNLPEVKRALEFPKQAIELIEQTRKMAHEGKFAPEAVSFIGRRWLKVQDYLDKLIEEFGV